MKIDLNLQQIVIFLKNHLVKIKDKPYFFILELIFNECI